MMRLQSVIVVLLVTAALANRSACQERGSDATGQPMATTSVDEQPMSIFNDAVRRFRFDLEEILVTSETAEQFMLRQQGHIEPAIIGAYADSETNSLVVVGPPDAEQTVRELLAEWMIERQAGCPPSLSIQKRALQYRRKELLREMAEIEVLLVGSEGDKAAQLRDRLEAFEDELAVVEKQIDVMNRYVQRFQNRDTPVTARTGVIATDRSTPPNAR